MNKITQIGILEKHEDKVWSLAWSPVEDMLASSGSDKKIVIWTNNTLNNTNNYINCYTAKAILEESHSRTIRALAWDHSGTYLASASFDSTINIWKKKVISKNNTDNNSIVSNSYEFECIASLEGHENEVKSVSWSISGNYLASCSRDKTIWIWDIEDETEFSCNNVLQGHTNDIKMVKWSPREDVLFSCSYDDLIKVWKFEEVQDDWLCVNTLKSHNSTVWAIDITQSGEYFITCGDDRSVILWRVTNINSGDYSDIKQVLKLNAVHSRPIFSVSFNWDDSLVAFGAGDNGISFWKVDFNSEEKLSLIEKVENAHEEDVNCVAWSRIKNKNILASCSDDSKIKLWQL